MKKTWIIIGIVLLIILVVIVWPISSWISTYNKMVNLEEGVKSAWAQVDNVCQRRMELIPSLVKTVKGVANYEKETLTQVIEARADATKVKIDPTNMTEANFKQFQEAQSKVSSTLSRLLVTVEQYPQLKATSNFTDLQNEITGSQNRISTELRRFNEAAQEYNTYIRRFFPRIVASFNGFKEKPYFKADTEASKVPDFDFESSSKKDK